MANFWEIRDWIFSTNFGKKLSRKILGKNTTSALRLESYYHCKEEGEVNNQRDLKKPNKQAHAQQIARERSMRKGQKTMKKVVSWNKKYSSIKVLSRPHQLKLCTTFVTVSIVTSFTTANSKFPLSSEWLHTIPTFKQNWQVFNSFLLSVLL